MRETTGHSMSLYVDHAGEPQVDHTGEPLLSWKYARTPWEVMTDPELGNLDIRVYGMISGSTYQGSTSKVGTRRIAGCIHASRRLVVESIHRLERLGHLKICNQMHGRRAVYLLTSEVFSQKQRAGVEEIVSGPGGSLRLASVRKDQGRAWNTRSAQPKSSDRTRDHR